MNKKYIFLKSLETFLNDRCQCGDTHKCDITQYELYKNVSKYEIINLMTEEIRGTIDKNDDDPSIYKKIQFYLKKQDYKLNKKTLDLFSLILISMISGNIYKRDYKGIVIRYFSYEIKSKL